MDINKYRIIDTFCNKVLSDKKYLKHSDIDLFINIRLTGLLNYMNLLNEQDLNFIEENFNKNHRYLTEIESEKSVEESKRAANNKIKKEDSILNFKIPQFEIYFVVKLIVNGNVIQPEVLTDLVLTSEFNESIIFRYKYKDLTPDAYLNINVYSMQLNQEKSLLASTCVGFFDENFNLLQGKHIFSLFDKFYLNKETNISSTKEADFYKLRNKLSGRKFDDQNFKEVDLLIHTYHNHHGGLINKNYLENNFKLERENKKANDNYTLNFEEKLNVLLSKTENSYLEILFPSFNYCVIYEEEKSNINSKFYQSLNIRTSNSLNKLDNWVCDPEIRKEKNFLSKDNPITEKFSILSRISDDAFARDIRPSHIEYSRIEELLNTPDFIKLEDSDIILFWKYRYSLLNRKYSLTKILNSVKWGESKSENEFIKNILSQWTEVEICDILYMLSFKFCMNPIYTKNIYPKMQEVRQYAVKNLEKLNETEINFILLQLVQALRYEDETNSPLRKFLISKCSKTIDLATSFFWFLRVEADDTLVNKKEALKMIETYKEILKEFESSLDEIIAEQINSQLTLRDKLIKVSNELSKVSKAENKKVKLMQVIKKDGALDMHKFNPSLQLPIDPNIRINGTIPESCRVFTSAKYPVKFTFTVTNESQEFILKDDPSIFEIMFKYGDDLRQDQLILQIISYMDNLLKKVHLDFEFTTYKVLATSKSDGFVEFVPNCNTIFDILKQHDDQINPYLKVLSQGNENSLEKTLEKTLESFINSCAGYCVVTYILGIGDRHLENLLIDKRGRLFHIDFGYILGKDPKLYPPPMKLCKQMVECMGGKNSKGYEEFKKKCVDAYLYLRINARLIVNMFYLMIHCGINELSENPENVLNKLHEKFVPNLNPQEASNSLLNKLEESVSAFYPYLMEKFHAWANYWK
jgi:phosphatidylinositol 3-kinase